jgi:DNA-binding LacI/PurR family transcriptional regulator
MKSRAILKAYSQVTIREVACAAGVSVSSAGDILVGRTGPKASYSSATRERVLKAALDLSYIPNLTAQRLRGKRSGYVGLILTYGLLDRSFGLMLQTLETEVHNGGRRLLLSIAPNKDEERAQARLMQAEQVEGILYGPVYGDISDRAEWCRNLAAPVVFFGHPHNSGFDEVGVNLKKAAEITVEHLYAEGHRRVGLLRATENFISVSISAGLYAGDLWVTREDLPLCDLSQLVEPIIAFADLWKRSSPKNRPTAVICHDDYMGLLTLNIFREKGIKVPEEISVIGLANLPESEYYSPPLTTVDVKLVERMQASVSILFDRIDGKAKGTTTHKQFDPELVIRKSVANIS